MPPDDQAARLMAKVTMAWNASNAEAEAVTYLRGHSATATDDQLARISAEALKKFAAVFAASVETLEEARALLARMTALASARYLDDIVSNARTAARRDEDERAAADVDAN
jgi:hypothetical protein